MNRHGGGDHGPAVTCRSEKAVADLTLGVGRRRRGCESYCTLNYVAPHSDDAGRLGCDGREVSSGR
jgi:hypothetical protein